MPMCRSAWAFAPEALGQLRIRLAGILILLVVGLSAACVADQTLTITLDPPKTEVKTEGQKDLRLNH